MKIIRSTSNSPAFNLATEEFIFSQSQDEILLLYINEPSVILGFNQVTMNEVNLDFCRENGIRIIRRMSGGGAVYHDLGNINYSFIGPRNQNESPLSSRFLDPLIEVLHLMNIPAEKGKRRDLWLDGYKISGTASNVTAHRELHHGTLLFDTNLRHLENSLRSKSINSLLKGTASVPSPVMNIKTYLSEHFQQEIPTQTFFKELTENFSKLYNIQLEECPVFPEAISLEKEKYSQETWNFRK